jgi:hypothetical protein
LIKLKFAEYFMEYGQDSCLLKSPKLFELIIENGLPEDDRGELWMVFSGACNMNLALDYYLKLQIENVNNLSLKPVLDEIEKDVRRLSRSNLGRFLNTRPSSRMSASAPYAGCSAPMPAATLGSAMRKQ